MDDATPIVILDQAEDLIALPGVASEPLTTADSHGTSFLGAAAVDSKSTAFLHALGITSPATWTAFGLGTVDDAIYTAFGLTGRRRPRTTGLTFPTWLPADPSHVVGLVRMTPGQCKHQFVTPPAGMSGPASLATASRVILTDHPGLALRLHQEGAADGNLALIEDPAVIAALLPWLSERSIVLVSQKASSVAWLGEAIGALNATADHVVLPGDFNRTSDEARAVLGLTSPRTSVVAPPITPRLLHDLHAYALARVAAGEGTAALARFGLSDPTIITAYGIGYLPLEFRDALSRDNRAALNGLRIADTLVVPAYDEQGVIVDLLAIHTRVEANTYITMFDAPRGLLAPVIATTHDSLIVTDTLHLVAKLSSQGKRNVLLLRGPADASLNAARLVAAGVTSVVLRLRLHAKEVAEVFCAAGIAVKVGTAIGTWDDGADVAVVVAVAAPMAVEQAVEKAAAEVSAPINVPKAVPAPVSAPSPSPVVLAEHNQQDERATFTAGDLTYVVEVPEDDSATQFDVVLRHAGLVHRDRLDVAVEAQRQRFAGSAAMRCGAGVSAAVVSAHLALIREQVTALQDSMTGTEQPTPDAVPAGRDRDAVLSQLRSPELLDQLAGDLDTLGWVDEPGAKRVLLLTAVSRKLPEPLWAIRTSATPLASNLGLDVIAAVTPPEDLIHVSRLSNAALTYQDANALCHKLLVIDEATNLSTELITALRVLHSRGALSQAIVPRHNLSGSARTKTIEVHGPLAVLAAGVGTNNHWLSSICCTVPVDGSPEQTARILAAERHRFAAAKTASHAALIRRHHTLQRMLGSHPVVIPFAERIHFPAASMHQRGEQARFLGLIAASALLHQYQRFSEDGHIVADVRDFHLAASLATAAGIGADPNMSQAAVELMGLMAGLPVGAVTMNDLLRQRPGWTRYAFRSALQELMDADIVTSNSKGRGAERSYLVDPGTRAVADDRPAIVLLETGVGEVGESWRENVANLTPCKALG